MPTKTEERIARLARQYNLGLISYDELLSEMSLLMANRTHEQIIEEELD